MNNYADLIKVVSCAVATDGGSIYLCLSNENGEECHFVLNRSCSSLGTNEYNRIYEKASSTLSFEQQEMFRAQLLLILEQTGKVNDCDDLVSAVIEHLAEGNDITSLII